MKNKNYKITFGDGTCFLCNFKEDLVQENLLYKLSDEILQHTFWSVAKKKECQLSIFRQTSCNLIIPLELKCICNLQW